MQSYFYTLFERISKNLHRDEILLANFCAETSDFVRINQSKVRQAGSVKQLELSLDLVNADQHAEAHTDISGDIDDDSKLVLSIIIDLRKQYAVLPNDPFLMVNQTVTNSQNIDQNRLPNAHETIRGIISLSGTLDLVGIFTGGTVFRGFANSLGQRNWYEKSSFNFDWSCFLNNNLAAKSSYTGFTWDLYRLAEKFDQLHDQLKVLGNPAKTIEPGSYRVYLAPTALREIMSTLAWRSFGAKAHKTRQSPLLKLAENQRELDNRIFLTENNAGGISPDFTPSGFIKPPQINLIDHGKHANYLINSRSAKEYGIEVNAASEYPQSLDLQGGMLDSNEILTTLDNGLYINNLWYSNFSDTNSCKITGMTRYACFWVENGQLIAPINPMRFDQSIYDMLGADLVDLTKTTEWSLESDTYERRSLASMRLPGILVNQFNLTL